MSVVFEHNRQLSKEPMLNCIIIHFVANSQSLRTKGDILCDTDKQSVKVLTDICR